MANGVRFVCGALIVRDHDDGLVEFAIQALEQGENFRRGNFVQIAGRLVGHDQSGIGYDRARAMATRCCCPPESCLG